MLSLFTLSERFVICYLKFLIFMKRFFTKHFILFIILIAVCILLIILYQISFLSPVDSIVYKITAPFRYVFLKISDTFSSGFKIIFTAKNLQKENIELKKEVNELKAKEAQLEELKVENDILRKQLDFAQHKEFQLVPCEIISYHPSNFLKNFTINKGKNQGINEKMAVTSSGLLVGQIIEVGDDYSVVSLITDTDSNIGGIVQDSRASGIVKGQLGYGLVMESIAQDEVIQLEQTVVTSGLGGEIPKGIVIGYIQDISGKPTDVFQSATLRPALDFRHLEMVFVITESK